MKNIRNSLIAVIAVLAGVTVFCVYKYIASVRENNVLTVSIGQLNSQVKTLEEEKNGLTLDLSRERELKDTLTRENGGLKEDLARDQAKLAQLESDFQASQKAIDELDSKFSLVKAENRALREKVQDLELDFNQAKVDREQLQARLNSIEELKKTIKELRIKARLTKKQVRRRIKIEEEMISGNNGFLIKDGKAIIPAKPVKVKIEVQPQPGS
jgi:chromosome segregation ATPase